MTEPSHMRVSTAEREAVVESLRGHAADGRIELEELEQRVEAALAARTRGELDALVADMPTPAPRARRRSRLPAALLLAVAAVAAVVFALTGAAGWVMWTAAGWALFSLKTGRLTCGAPPRRRHLTA